ncbi:MFS transporter [Clostridium tyrobutyricum]|uniref:Drug resistance transporter, EmrB/QacA family n=1 Tax=Clostridium tyrobutyricum DIVETGP TaxID=1408889 RepID=W6N9N5_CLOTY|nr:MDR family MFS transporter [Clostridium tyrobutyricum]AND83799.1 permease, MDR related [Clostridium tyrobutyricum]ANP68555.1 permease [Clostridium tyrobutyricum]MBV4435072.1 MFS transporter [Clostridium tyrobutyricum]QNB67101.1 MFS transporter [Clostridium tyrobutyricum]CDL92234.1 drug resistance transporter, EmrB/QacA family [Clostridium tyrobutyricum DIVETGP]
MGSRKKNILMALTVAMFLAAVEGTVVTTAIPTISRDLQGFQIISLVFSVYLLASAISTPIYGKLSDLYGRKNMLSIGIIMFLIGSCLCGLSQNMYMLIGFRVIQGLGAGSIFTLTYTIIGDVFTIEERPKVQGIIGTVWGVASLTGPFLGGILIDTLSWHWIFFINMPFGILSVILIQKNIKENFEKKRCKIDFAGIVTLSLAMIIFLNIFVSGQNKNSTYIFNIISVLAAVVLLIAFYKIEEKAEEPIIPFSIFTRSITITNLVSFLASTVLIGADVYFPIYIQNVLGFSAKISGLALAPMSVAWLIASVVLGKLIVVRGAKFVVLVSNFILIVGTILLPTLGINSPILLVLIYVFIMGFGFGGAFTTLTIVIQESVGYNQRGAVTASNALVRTLGQTIGVSVFGGIFNLFIVKYFVGIGIKGVDPGNLYKASGYNSNATVEQIKFSLNSSLHVLFIILIAISVLSLIISIAMPKEEKSEI